MQLLARNGEYLRLFLEGRGLSKTTERNYMMVLGWLDKFVGGRDFKDLTEDDMRAFMRLHEENKASTRTLYVTLFKKFFQWLHKYRRYTYPECVDWMLRAPLRQRLPVMSSNDLLTEDEVKRLIEASNCTRDRALWITLYEGGLRIGEALSMKVGSVAFEKTCSSAVVDGKTGQRMAIFVQATPFLREWLNVHPERNNPDAWLWISNRGKRLFHTTIRANLRRALKRAGITKKVWPHLFRHTQGTESATYLTPAELCEKMGWKQGSSQSRVYVHLSGSADIKNKTLEHYGLKQREEKKIELLKPVSCPRCNEPNPATGKYCFKCGSYLSLEEAMKTEKEKTKKMELMEREQSDMKKAIETLTNTLSDIMNKHTLNL